MPSDIFFSHLRMETATFNKLCNLLKPSWSIRNRPGPHGISLENALYLTVWKLANQSSFREVSDRFNFGRGTTYRAFVKTTGLISQLKTQLIKFPSTELSQKRTMELFETSRARMFPFVLGCVDGTHIRIPQPFMHGISYYNRKGTCSIVVQIANSDSYIDAFVGYPGRCHDASIWRNSPLRKAILEKRIPFPPECHLLGDAAYPLETFLMVPFRDNGHLLPEQIRFNTVLSSTRVCIEQAFGILKKKFRILNYVDVQNLKIAKQIIRACLVLHYLIINNEKSPENVDIDTQYFDNSSTNTEQTSAEAKNKRNRLATLFSA